MSCFAKEIQHLLNINYTVMIPLDLIKFSQKWYQKDIERKLPKHAGLGPHLVMPARKGSP